MQTDAAERTPPAGLIDLPEALARLGCGRTFLLAHLAATPALALCAAALRARAMEAEK